MIDIDSPTSTTFNYTRLKKEIVRMDHKTRPKLCVAYKKLGLIIKTSIYIKNKGMEKDIYHTETNPKKAKVAISRQSRFHTKEDYKG